MQTFKIKLNPAVTLLAFAACISSTGDRKPAESLDTPPNLPQTQEVPDTRQVANEAPAAYDTASEEGDDCVFNNDFKGLTTEWLAELKITNFIWREDLKSALIPNGVDTTLLSQGGCGHFGISVELILRTKTAELSDSAYWISKALEIADQYKMTDYAELIRKGKLKISNKDEDRVWYEMLSETDTEVYEGISVIVNKDFKRLTMSKYFY
ncbi:MAG: hypothetical protein JNJ75_00910 [Cyclobacteriaceae bacterium]|nr:hypothetical protein [Cyclobacteriaceae bacterium]